MATPLTSIRIPAGEKAIISAAATREGVSLSEFVIAAALERAATGRASSPLASPTRRQEPLRIEPVGSGPIVRSAADQDPSARTPVRAGLVPSKAECTSRVQKGSWCKVCLSMH